MFPLIFNYKGKFSFVISILVFVLSCSDSSKKNLAIIKVVDESLNTSNQLLFSSIRNVLFAMEDKLSYPPNKERVNYWYPKAKSIESISEGIFIHIEGIKKDLLKEVRNEIKTSAVKRFFLKRGPQIIDSLINYKKKILDIGSSISFEFEKSLLILSDSKNFIETYFGNASLNGAVSMLSYLQNNIRIVELKIISFCYENSSAPSFGPCTYNSPIIALNSTIVQAGEELEITAGVGSFFNFIEPEFFVFGRRIPLGKNDLFKYKLNAAKKPGKYYIPVKINYTDQDGITQTFKSEITYTVAEVIKSEQ